MATGAGLERQLERRASVRFQLSLPVVFSWTDRADYTGAGFTLNVAVGGAFVLCDQCPAEQAQVKLEVVIPNTERQGAGLKLKCVGQVTRITKAQNCPIGFAVEGCFTDEQLTQLVAEENPTN